jgi:CRISPR-associated protein Cmr2
VTVALAKHEGAAALKVAAIDAEAWFAGRLDERDRIARETAGFAAALRAAAPQGGPTPFFGMLRLDVDELGQAIQGSLAPLAAAAISRYAVAAPEVVRAHGGFVVFAAGDDLLALLPVAVALRCVVELRQLFVGTVTMIGREREIPVSAQDLTVSAAIVFAHVKAPLGRTIRVTGTLLEEQAKDVAGRDSIAIEVLKPGGVAARWAMPWECALVPEQAGEPRMLRIEELARALVRGVEAEGFASGFFHKLRERLSYIAPGHGSALSREDLIELMAADYLASFHDPASRPDWESAKKAVMPILEAGQPAWRIVSGAGTDRTVEYGRGEGYASDAAMIARFLVAEGAVGP